MLKVDWILYAYISYANCEVLRKILLGINIEMTVSFIPTCDVIRIGVRLVSFVFNISETCYKAYY